MTHMKASLLKASLLSLSIIVSCLTGSSQELIYSKEIEVHQSLPPGPNDIMESIDDDSFLMYHPTRDSSRIVKYNSNLEEELVIDISNDRKRKAHIEIYGIDLTEATYFPHIWYSKATDRIHVVQAFSKHKNFRCIHSTYSQADGTYLNTEVVIRS